MRIQAEELADSIGSDVVRVMQQLCKELIPGKLWWEPSYFNKYQTMRSWQLSQDKTGKSKYDHDHIKDDWTEFKTKPNYKEILDNFFQFKALDLATMTVEQ